MWRALTLRTQAIILVVFASVLFETASVVIDYRTIRATEINGAFNEAIAYTTTIATIARGLDEEGRARIVDRASAAGLEVAFVPQWAFPGFDIADENAGADLDDRSQKARALHSTLEAAGLSPTRTLAELQPRRGRILPRGRGEVIEIAAAFEGNGHVLAASFSVPLDAVASAILTHAIIDVAITLLLVVVVVSIFGTLSRPIVRLARAAERFGRGEDVAPLGDADSHDVRVTIRAFEQMVRRVNQSVEYQLSLMRSLGHDLRTPITTAAAIVEGLRPAEQREAAAARLRTANDIVAGITQFTRATMRDGKLMRVDVSSLVEALVEEAEDGGHDVRAKIKDDALVMGRANALERAIRNLLENALKYGGRASVTVSATGGEVRVEVADDGPGIPDEMMESAFRPFERLDPEKPGSGLGLAIAKTVIVDHGGTLTLANRPEGGLLATVILPQEGDGPALPETRRRQLRAPGRKV